MKKGIIQLAKSNGGKNHKTSKWSITKGVIATDADEAYGYVAGNTYTVFVATKDFESKSGTTYTPGDWFAIIEE